MKVFDKNSVYLPTKKIGKNNPKAAEIAADNAARQEWNRTADMALVSGISEAKIIEVKQAEITTLSAAARALMVIISKLGIQSILTKSIIVISMQIIF